MKYRSTRGGEEGLHFEQVLFAGYAKDRGLYMPEEIPRISVQELRNWASLSYPDVVYEVTRKFISAEEINDSDLRRIVGSSFKKFSPPDVIGVTKVGNLSVIELFHGPTLAFKDIALSVVGGLLEFFLSGKDQRVVALVGTSGDTGSAAIESVRGRKNIDIIVMYPKNRVTAIQELQMTTVTDDNVHVIAVDGTSDDLDVPIKQCFADHDLVTRSNLLSMNSLNWARILTQIPMYFFAYFRTTPSVGQYVELLVPTGAAGSVTAGCLAHKMGLPVHFTVAVNANDIVARTLLNCDFSMVDEVKETLSPAMDIQIPYNMERLLFLFSNYEPLKVKLWMEEFESKGSVHIPEDVISQITNVIKNSHVASDADVVRVMKRVQSEYTYLLCPHTAVAVAYHFKELPTCSRGVMATASPSKFPEAVKAAGEKPPTKGIKHLEGQSVGDIPFLSRHEDWLEYLKEEIRSITQKRN